MQSGANTWEKTGTSKLCTGGTAKSRRTTRRSLDQRRSSPSPFTSETHISASLLPFPSSPGCQSSLRSAPEDSLPCSRANNPTAAALTSRKVAPGRGLQSLQLWTSTLLLPNKRFAPHARVNPRYVRPWPPASSGGGHAASASTADNFFFFIAAGFAAQSDLDPRHNERPRG